MKNVPSPIGGPLETADRPAPDGVHSAPLLRPAWRRTRFWLVLALVVLLTAVTTAALSSGPAAPLDPSSPSRAGSKALAVLLAQRGTTVARTTDLAQAASAGGPAPAASTVLVAFPDAYSTGQLARLIGSGHRVVLAGASEAVVRSVRPAARVVDQSGGYVTPGCDDAAAVAAGGVDFPGATLVYGDVPGCFGGRIVVAGSVVVLGSAELLRNDTLADSGVAALDLNLLSDNGASTRLVWLLPGRDAATDGGASIWGLFPGSVHRAALWLLLLGLLVALWRGRRLGPVVQENLPVVVRASEVVEGHGRLYRRAHARDRAATALRRAAIARLTTQLALLRPALTDVASAASVVTHRPAEEIMALLAGADPIDDAGLLRLAGALDTLETAAATPAPPASPRPNGQPHE